MDEYFVNTGTDNQGDHEVHKAGCAWMPSSTIALGLHAGCFSAVQEAKRYYSQTNGCAFCSPLCHTS